MDETTNQDHEENVDYKSAAFNAINENERLRAEIRNMRAAISIEEVFKRIVDFVEEHYIFCIVVTYVLVNLFTVLAERRR